MNNQSINVACKAVTLVYVDDMWRWYTGRQVKQHRVVHISPLGFVIIVINIIINNDARFDASQSWIQYTSKKVRPFIHGVAVKEVLLSLNCLHLIISQSTGRGFSYGYTNHLLCYGMSSLVECSKCLPICFCCAHNAQILAGVNFLYSCL